jgi:hypothetical protein
VAAHQHGGDSSAPQQDGHPHIGGRTSIDRLIARLTRRPPDFLIGGAERPYIRRWWLIPRNRIFNVYLHHFLRSDDDRALHDHPWLFNLSVMLRGAYTEQTIAAGGVTVDAIRRAGQCKLRLGPAPHRLELHEGQCWTLFVTGPVVRQWGFHCPRGWVHWKDFTDTRDKGAVGKGCDQ